MSRKPELIAPAGNMECARAAVANGADAVYFGMPRFNARIRADNFTDEEVPTLVKFLHQHGVRAFAAINTLIFTSELADVEAALIQLDEAEVDVIIVQDLGVALLARELGVRMAVHASTQMTITSPEGSRFVEKLGIQRVVLARETSLRELHKFGQETMPLEVFVHGALCVAYSGQCLTSEALGQRSANRGECAQACRLPYELVVDGILKELGDRRYLLSPQDLSAVREIPELIKLGISSFKIEGRLKTPEYVAAVTQIYRKAIDAALENPDKKTDPSSEDEYQLEMAFSRGLYSGWMHGVNHQKLVHARYGKKRGAFVGYVKQVGTENVDVELESAIQPGDGVVFDTGGNPDHEQGGRVYEIRGNSLAFKYGHIDFTKVRPGDRVWKTSDPHLERELQKTFKGLIPVPKITLDLKVSGSAGQSLTLEGRSICLQSKIPLQIAEKRPLTTESLREQLGRLGETPFVLGELDNHLIGNVILPLSELNRLRRELIAQINVKVPVSLEDRPKCKPALSKFLLQIRDRGGLTFSSTVGQVQSGEAEIVVLCRTMDQIRAAMDGGCKIVYVDFEDIRRYREAVIMVRENPEANIFLATPRIQKAGEQGFFKLIEAAEPDGVLVRNLGAIDYFRTSSLEKIGDFSLNVANPLTAQALIMEGLARVTISYDLNAQQVLDLLNVAPPSWFELTIHQHMPMFHMEHCVFAAFLSEGTDHTNCGRPCDRHSLKLRDRLGIEHPVKADVGCRNTVYHARAQSGADFLAMFRLSGARVFRIELLDESYEKSKEILRSYTQLLDGTANNPGEVMNRLNAVKQLGVTNGTLTVLT
jgi:U32 family peptidase